MGPVTRGARAHLVAEARDEPPGDLVARELAEPLADLVEADALVRRLDLLTEEQDEDLLDVLDRAAERAGDGLAVDGVGVDREGRLPEPDLDDASVGSRIGYRGATVTVQRMPGARLSRASAVSSGQPSSSARATYPAS